MTAIEKSAQHIADQLGVKMDAGSAMLLPDGSGCFTASKPLPKDHWSCVDADGFNVPPMLLRMAHNDPSRQMVRKAIIAAGRYAVRASTMNGKEPDFDPDALCLNMVVGLIGYATDDGLIDEDWGNPKPIPPLFSLKHLPEVPAMLEIIHLLVSELDDLSRIEPVYRREEFTGALKPTASNARILSLALENKARALFARTHETTTDSARG